MLLYGLHLASVIFGNLKRRLGSRQRQEVSASQLA
jgi:hypothetical protein